MIRAKLRRSLLVAVLLAASTLVHAEPTPAQIEEAKREFEAGQAAYNLGQWDAALSRYTKAYELSKMGAILFNLAQVRRKLAEKSHDLNDLREARELYKSYLRAVPINSNREMTEGLIKEVEQTYAKLLAEQRDKLLAETRGVPALGLAEDFLGQGDLVAADTALARFVRTPGNKRSDVARGERVRARLSAQRGDERAAEDAWARALSLDPATAPPPSTDEKSKPSFDRAALRMKGKPPLAVRHVPQTRLKIGQVPRLRFDVDSDPLGIVRTLSVHYRADGGAFATISVAPGDVSFPPELNAGLRAGTKIEYHVEVLDADGAVLDHLGSDTVPFAMTVDAKPPKPIHKRWQFWVGLGAGVLVAGGVAAAVGVTQAPPTREVVPVSTAPALTFR